MNLNEKTVFMVDDDITILTIGKNVLSKAYNVFTMNSGAKLMNMLEDMIPDAILLDIEMPETNGYDLIKIIKSNSATEKIPIILLTAKNDDESELEGLSLGAIDYIVKPFSPPLLLKRIELHLLVEDQKKKLIKYNNNLHEMVDAKTKTVQELQNAVLKTMAELVEFRDDITGEHIERTQSYLGILISELIKRGLYREELSVWNIEQVLQSSQLHDVGKIAISDGILKKPGKLTNEEFDEIKKHPEFGEKVIDKIKNNSSEHDFLEQAKIFAISHHEKWDGTGYPKGLKGEEIPLQGRLMAIADVYDALAFSRSYKQAFPHDEAVEIILDEKGKHFDPELIEIFKAVSDEFARITAEFIKNSINIMI